MELRDRQTHTMTEMIGKYSINLNCNSDMSVLIHHLSNMYDDKINYEQFALAISYSNQTTIGLLSNVVFMLSSIFYASCANETLDRPFNILLKQTSAHNFMTQKKNYVTTNSVAEVIDS
jgi:hypothetical protein